MLLSHLLKNAIRIGSLEVIDAGGAGLAQIAIDDDDPLHRPPQGDRPLAQGILPSRALGVLEDLANRGLTYVQIGVSFEMVGGDFVGVMVVHAVASRDVRPPLRIMFVSTKVT